MMTKAEGAVKLTNTVAKFLTYTGKVLPDDVREKITELAGREEEPLAKAIYSTMIDNQRLAQQLNRPSCQDTGAIQYFLKCGTAFPYMAELPELLRNATMQATQDAPLRHNAVETFDEYNTGKNVAKQIPSLFWDIVPGADTCEIYTYMAGGGCSLPGKARVLMPGEGYEGVTRFVLDVMTSYGLNACPPLLVGVGIGTSVEVAALHSKKALLRQIGSHNENPRAAKMEQLLEDGINAIGLETRSMETALALAGAGLGATILPEFLLQSFRPAKLPCYALLPERPEREVILAWRKNKYLSKAARTFIAELKEFCR